MTHVRAARAGHPPRRPDARDRSAREIVRKDAVMIARPRLAAVVAGGFPEEGEMPTFVGQQPGQPEPTVTEGGLAPPPPDATTFVGVEAGSGAPTVIGSIPKLDTEP
jgi:hypothetical protein